MQKSLTDCAAFLSGSNIDILEEIISNKYRKFIKFFKLIEDYADDITALEYEFTDEASLSAKINFKKSIKFEEKKELISNWKKAGYDVDYEITKKKIKITIVHQE